MENDLFNTEPVRRSDLAQLVSDAPAGPIAPTAPVAPPIPIPQPVLAVPVAPLGIRPKTRVTCQFNAATVLNLEIAELHLKHRGQKMKVRHLIEVAANRIANEIISNPTFIPEL
jgi:hypothetical protein